MFDTEILDIFFILACGVLVLLMQVGFLCLESGLTRSKNAINVAMKNAADFVLTIFVFWMFGFGLMFGESSVGLFGGSYFFFDLGQGDPWTASVFVFQSVFCATAATIVSGVIAERVKFNGYLVLTFIIVGIVYPVSGHWAWAGALSSGSGWLAQLGFVDFAGSTVVHSVGGWVGLSALLVVGPRLGRFVDGKAQNIPSSSPTIALAGIMLFVVGWLGFNGGSTLSLNMKVPGIVANTMMAAAVGAIVGYAARGLFLDRGSDPLLAPSNGCLAGLVSITASCHAVSTIDAIAIGAVGAIVMLTTQRWMLAKQLDDAIGAIPVHLAAGVWGTLAVAIFGNAEALGTGLTFWQQLRAQMLGIVVIGLWAFFVSYLLIRVIDRVWPLRVSIEDEQVGLNVSEHGARTDLIDLLSAMNQQEQELNLESRMPVEPFTEVGQFAQGYNRVMDALESAVSQTRAIVRDIRDAIVTFGEDGMLISFNPAAEKIFGYSASGAIGRPLHILFYKDVKTVKQADSQILGNLRRDMTTEIVGQRRNSRPFHMEVTLTEGMVDNDRRYTAVIRDIDDKRRIEDQLFKEKERAMVTLSSIADGVITTDIDGNVNYLNEAAQVLTGWLMHDAIGIPLSEVYRTSDPDNLPSKDLVKRALAGNITNIETQNTVLMSRSGSERAITHTVAPIRDSASVVFGAVVVFHDVTSSRALERKLSHQAKHDVLTGALNRSGFDAVAGRLISQTKHVDDKHILGFLDLDQFKIVNDSCGHLAGDELLRQVCSLIKEQLRIDDVVARLGGDEFAILLRDCSRVDGERVAEAIRKAIQDFRFPWDKRHFSIGVSIGLVTINYETKNLSTLMGAADAACYAAKDKGRNRVQFHEQDDIEAAQRRGQIHWVSRIRDAIDHENLRLYYQTIKSFKKDEQEHVEILIRMVGDDGEALPPGAFIPIAERYNLIQEIDMWVVENTFLWFSTLSNENKSRLVFAINLSGASIGDPTCLNFIIELLQKYQIDGANVCFEVTETAAISNLDAATRFIHRLKKEGCKFSLDDFGSGLSSFGYLKNLPVDYLKIDGDFVRDIDVNKVDRVMVQSINTIGHEMGLLTIAEYVENEVVSKQLIDMGVDYGQGYYYSMPIPIDQWLPSTNHIEHD